MDLHRVQGHLEAAIKANNLLAEELKAVQTKVGCKPCAACKGLLHCPQNLPLLCAMHVIQKWPVSACSSTLTLYCTPHVQAAQALCGVP